MPKRRELMVKRLTLLAVLTSNVQARTYFVPSVQRMGYTGSDQDGFARRSEFEFDELDNSVEDDYLSSVTEVSLNSVGSGEQYKFNKWYDNRYNEDNYGRMIVNRRPISAIRPVKRRSIIPHISISENKLARVGSSIVYLLKGLIAILLVIGIPALFLQLVLIPLKLLIGLKMVILAKAITIGVLAAEYFFKSRPTWNGWGSPGPFGGPAGWGGLPLLYGLGAAGIGGLVAISNPVSNSNNNQPVSQPVLQYVSNPVQQLQNVDNFNNGGGGGGCCGCCGCGGGGIPVWELPFWIAIFNNLINNSNSNTNNNSNINSITNTNTNTNINDNSNTNTNTITDVNVNIANNNNSNVTNVNNTNSSINSIINILNSKNRTHHRIDRNGTNFGYSPRNLVTLNDVNESAKLNCSKGPVLKRWNKKFTAFRKYTDSKSC